MKVPEALFHTFYSRLLSDDNPEELRKNNSFKIDCEFLNTYHIELERFVECDFIKVDNEDLIITLTKNGVDRLVEIRGLRGLDLDIKILDYESAE